MLTGRIVRLREDDRFKAVGPDAAVMSTPSVPHHNHQHSGPPSAGLPKPDHEEGEMWFDWAFVDFWKSNYCEFRLAMEHWRRAADGMSRGRCNPEGGGHRPEFGLLRS